MLVLVSDSSSCCESVGDKVIAYADLWNDGTSDLQFRKHVTLLHDCKHCLNEATIINLVHNHRKQALGQLLVVFQPIVEPKENKQYIVTIRTYDEK